MEQSRINVVNLHVLSSIQTAINELDDLSAFTRKDDDIFCSNAEFDLHVGDLSDFIDSDEKDDATLHHALVTPNRVEEKIMEWGFG